jgi:hypothetical protein
VIEIEKGFFMTNFDAVPVETVPFKLYGVRLNEPYASSAAVCRASNPATAVSNPALTWIPGTPYREELMAGLEPGQVREIAFITAERIHWADAGDVLVCNSPRDPGQVDLESGAAAGETELDLHLSGVDQFDPLEEGKRVGTL